MNADEQTFETAILTSWSAERGERSYVLFSSPICQPCQRMKATIERMEGDLGIFYVNVFHAHAAALNANIRSVPTLVRFEQGRETARITGELNEPKLREFLDV